MQYVFQIHEGTWLSVTNKDLETLCDIHLELQRVSYCALTHEVRCNGQWGAGTEFLFLFPFSTTPQIPHDCRKQRRF